jgi:hypothetical protein
MIWRGRPKHIPGSQRSGDTRKNWMVMRHHSPVAQGVECFERRESRLLPRRHDDAAGRTPCHVSTSAHGVQEPGRLRRYV